jgi:hypothetical protein
MYLNILHYGIYERNGWQAYVIYWIVCSLFNDAFSIAQTVQRRMNEWRVNYEFEIIWNMKGSGRGLI